MKNPAGMEACSCRDEEAPPLRPLALALSLTATVFAVELAGGWWTGSLALLADAAHVAIDLIALAMALFAALLGRRPPDSRRTFGYRRVEVLAALGNAVALWVATGIILREAYFRFFSPTPVAAKSMIALAGVGLACNLASGLILARSSRRNINLRGAFLHVATDALGALGAMLAGAVILETGWYQADAVASGLICVGIIATSYWLLRDSIRILLEGAPARLDIEEVRSALAALDGVKEVHDLHLWSLTEGSESMSGHLVIEPGRDSHAVLGAGRALLKERFRLGHVTLQVEKQD